LPKNKLGDTQPALNCNTASEIQGAMKELAWRGKQEITLGGGGEHFGILSL
jgi:hypothetical protein